MNPTELLEIFAKYGGMVGILMGVIIIGCGFALLTLWKQLQLCQDQLVDKTSEFQGALKIQAAEFSASLAKVHERRIEDGDKIRDKTVEMFDRHRETIGKLGDSVAVVSANVSTVSQNVATVAANVASLRDTILLTKNHGNNGEGR
jgi:DNA anti-recombination protein RmuC